MKNPPPEIHVVVAIPLNYVKRQQRMKKFSLQAEPIYRQKNKTKSIKKKESLQAEIDKINQAYLKERAKNNSPVGNPTNMGYFLSQADALDAIKRYPDTISEGGYHVYITVERKPEGLLRIDDSGKAEYWLKLKDDGTYSRCKKPACLKGTIDFAS